MTEQLTFVPDDAAELLDDTAALRLRVEYLEQQLAAAKDTAEQEKLARLNAESCREQWRLIATAAGRTTSRDNLAAMVIAHDDVQRQANHVGHRIQTITSELLSTRGTAEALAHFARLVPKMPTGGVKALPHEVKFALHWAFSDGHRHYDLLPAIALPAAARAEIHTYVADWLRFCDASRESTRTGRSVSEVLGDVK